METTVKRLKQPVPENIYTFLFLKQREAFSFILNFLITCLLPPTDLNKQMKECLSLVANDKGPTRTSTSLCDFI